MHVPRRIVLGFGLALILAAPGAAPLQAQTCDYMVTSASWSNHPHPDSIYVHFIPNVDGPTPQNPTQYDMNINIWFQGQPLEPPHPLILRWAHGIGCPVGCPHVICEEKEWSYKGVVFRDRSFCTENAQGVCGCPPLGTPVPHQKAVRKPPGQGTIEIEIVPLNLQSCNPINPGNDRSSFQYPGGGGSDVPGAAPWGMGVLVGALAIAAFAAMWRRGYAGSAPAMIV